MLKDLIIYVDFDSTVYDTPRFAQDLWKLIAYAAGNLSVDKVAKDALKFYADPNLGGYDYEAHIHSYNLNPSAMWLELEELVSENAYLYSDSPQFIQSLCSEGYRPHILSFGEERFQAIKIKSTLQRLVGSTSHQIGFDVVMRQKREHIIEYHPGKRGVLIDDKPDQDLPDEFVEITLDRSTELKDVRQNGTIYTASNLLQAADIIHSL